MRKPVCWLTSGLLATALALPMLAGAQTLRWASQGDPLTMDPYAQAEGLTNMINGQIYGGPRDYNSINDIVQLILLGKRQYTACPPVTVQGSRQYIATLQTEKGKVVIQLFADKAPITVNSFIFLARNGWYDNITFHRVIPDLFAQTGDPSGTGKGNPGYYLITEIDPSMKFTTSGMVAMVNSGPDTSGSQFFITYGPTTQYDGQYTIFGQVLSGMEIVESLTPRDAQPGTETPPGDKLISITIDEK